ncbi:hypothetical protein [Methylobacterium mesophilicum]|uniref:hypothetical protein n=1 Tax=Methylobacterium mesophilicum TaxID=39956 RepID=UPI002F344CD9
MSPGFFDALLTACAAVRPPTPNSELVTLAILCLTSLAMVALGWLLTRGAVKDVLDVMERLPPAPDKEDDRAAARKRALKDFKSLLYRRSAPGIILAVAWAAFLLTVAFRLLYRIAP